MITKKLKFQRLFKTLRAIVKSDVWILDGQETSTGENLRILVSGKIVQKNYITQIAFNGVCKEMHLGRLHFWHLYSLIRNNIHNCSLAFIEGDDLHRLIYQKRTDFFIPLWLASRTDIPIVAQNGNLKGDLRRIKNHKLEYAITTDTEQLHDFYFNMYLPTINKRHADRAIAMEYNEMMLKVREGCCELLLVKKEGVSVSGQLILTHKRKPRLWSCGVRDANPEHWRNGAIAAPYYFSAHYLAERGYKKMHMGFVRNFLNDGVLQFNKKLNARVSAAGADGFIIKPLRISKGTKGFFMNHPFAYISKKQLCGAVFVPSDQPCTDEDLKRFQKSYYLTGLSKLNIFQLDDKCCKAL